IGPQARSLEVQIRTREMHEHAELGVAAHWTYKEGGPRDAQYQRKIEWVRRLLEPQDGAAGEDAERDFVEGMRAELFEDRVYPLTPKGEGIDLPPGAPPPPLPPNRHTSPPDRLVRHTSAQRGRRRKPRGAWGRARRAAASAGAGGGRAPRHGARQPFGALGAAAAVAERGMDVVGEVERRRAARQVDHLAL